MGGGASLRSHARPLSLISDIAISVSVIVTEKVYASVNRKQFPFLPKFRIKTFINAGISSEGGSIIMRIHYVYCELGFMEFGKGV